MEDGKLRGAETENKEVEGGGGGMEGGGGRDVDIREGDVDTEKQAAVNQGIGQAQNEITD